MLASACATAGPSTSPDRRSAGATASSSERDVRAALSSFLTAFNNLDWEAFRGAFAADATLFNPDIPEARGPGRVDGREAIESSFRSVFEAVRGPAGGPSGPHIVPRNIRIQMIGDAAVATFEFDREHGSIGRRSLVFQKRDDGWKIVHVHASNSSSRG